MRQLKTDFLTPTENTNIANDVADLMDDPSIGVSITFRDYQSRTLTPSTGAVVPVYTDTNTGAVREELKASEIAASGGKYQMGDVRYLIARSDVSVTPTREDRVVEGADTFEVIAWTTDPISKMWNVVARKVK